VAGADAATTITALARNANPSPTRIVDIGCGRGTTTARLAREFPDATVAAIDQSPALLAAARDRLHREHLRAALIAADFHRLPLAGGSVDLAVAAFCLYHSPHPEHALTEISRCLRPGGHLIVTTKSADSYRAIDTRIADSGLDPDAALRPSLYQTFHRANAEQTVSAAGLLVRDRVDQQHTFRFDGLDHLADYAATCPKYQLPAELTHDPQQLTLALRERLPDTPTIATSTVTYLVAVKP